MTYTKQFSYKFGEHKVETASNNHLMSLIAIILVLLLPTVNLKVGTGNKGLYLSWVRQ